MFEDEARFGRISEPHRCWAPKGVRPSVPVQMAREYEYAYAAVSPHDGVLDTLVLPQVNTEAMGVFLAEVARRHADEFILMVLDGAGWHRAKRLPVPGEHAAGVLTALESATQSRRACLGRVARKVFCQPLVPYHGPTGCPTRHWTRRSGSRHATHGLADRLRLDYLCPFNCALVSIPSRVRRALGKVLYPLANQVRFFETR
jgi:DDE superfamily endonuclease